MMRQALLWASTNPFMSQRLPSYEFVRKATRRFMPGEELQDALDASARFGDVGIATTVTLLGENVETAAEADGVLDHYLGALTAIQERGVDTEISLKLTSLGLDQGVGETRARLDRLVEAAGAATVWVDMEYSGYVDRTIEVFRGVRERRENVGLCLQSYLKRTEKDLKDLLPLEPAIRLVKGAYAEPPSVAFVKKAQVDQSFIRLTSTLLRARAAGRAGRPVIGTHDPRMIGEANRMAHELQLGKDRYEIAMLYGIQSAEQQRLTRTGHRVRVLISYGKHWFPWYMRRLAERPANVWFVVKQLVG